MLFFLFCFSVEAQNIVKKQIEAKSIKAITVNGNQIFNISVETTQTNNISVVSKLDGEYQNKYQIATKEDNVTLTLSLEFMSFEDIPDDKRNAHKVIAAELKIEIPENFDLNIISDIGSVQIKGKFNNIFIELIQGYCNVNATGNFVTINTVDGDITVATTNASVVANSKHGIVNIVEFKSKEFIWDLRSINGNITVTKQE